MEKISSTLIKKRVPTYTDPLSIDFYIIREHPSKTIIGFLKRNGERFFDVLDNNLKKISEKKYKEESLVCCDENLQELLAIAPFNSYEVNKRLLDIITEEETKTQQNTHLSRIKSLKKKLNKILSKQKPTAIEEAKVVEVIETKPVATAPVVELVEEPLFEGGGNLEPNIYYFEEDGNDITFTDFDVAYSEAKKRGYGKFRDNLGGEYFVDTDAYGEGGNTPKRIKLEYYKGISGKLYSKAELEDFFIRAKDTEPQKGDFEIYEKLEKDIIGQTQPDILFAIQNVIKTPEQFSDYILNKRPNGDIYFPYHSPEKTYELEKKSKGKYEQGGNTPTELKGYRVNIYKSDYNSPMNLVSFDKNSAILVTDGKQGSSQKVMSDEPYLKLVKRNIGGKDYLSAEPVNYGSETAWKMFGGTFIWSSDSRFRQDVSSQPVPLHDRVEMAKGGSVELDFPFEMEAKAIEFITGTRINLDSLRREGQNFVFKYKGHDKELQLSAKLLADTISMHKKSLEGRTLFENGGNVTQLESGAINYLGDLWFAVKDGESSKYKEIADALDELKVPFKIQNLVSADAETFKGRKSIISNEEVQQRIAKILKENNTEHHYAVGGNIGQTVSFNDWYGEQRTGTIIEKLEDGNYSVSSGFGNVLVQPEMITSYGKSADAEPKKKLFGFFEDGGNITRNKYFIKLDDGSTKEFEVDDITKIRGVYFSMGYHDEADKGAVYVHYNNALRPLFNEDGTKVTPMPEYEGRDYWSFQRVRDEEAKTSKDLITAKNWWHTTLSMNEQWALIEKYKEELGIIMYSKNDYIKPQYLVQIWQAEGSPIYSEFLEEKYNIGDLTNPDLQDIIFERERQKNSTKSDTQFGSGGTVGMPLTIDIKDVSGFNYILDLTKSRKENALIIATKHAKEINKKLTEKRINFFETDPTPFWRVRDLVEDKKIGSFLDSVKIFKYLYPLVDKDWQYALELGLVFKSKQTEGNYASTPYIYNDELAVRVRENGINNLDPIIEEILNSDKYEEGGNIPNNYEGKTPEQIWSNWDLKQRYHFLSDHSAFIQYIRGMEGDENIESSEIRKIMRTDWDNLDEDIKLFISNHVNEGQYEKGGNILEEGTIVVECHKGIPSNKKGRIITKDKERALVSFEPFGTERWVSLTDLANNKDFLEGKFEEGGNIYSDESAQEIASTILMQLGGTGRLKAFIGATNFVYDKEGSISFKFKGKKANYVRITLNAVDYYDVVFKKISGMNVKLVSEFKDVDFEQLIPLFEKETGLYLRFEDGGNLFKGGGVIPVEEPKEEPKEEVSVTRVATYIPNRDIKDLTLFIKDKYVTVDGTSILDGVYLKKSFKQKLAQKNANPEAIYKKIKSDTKSLDVKVKELASLKLEDIKEFIELGATEEQIRNIYLGYSFDHPVGDSEFGEYKQDNLWNWSEEYRAKNIKMHKDAFKENVFILALEYPLFDWKAVIEKYDINSKPIIHKNEDGAFQIFEGKGLVFANQFGFGTTRNPDESLIIESLNKPSKYQKERKYNAGFNGSYWTMITRDSRIIDDVLKLIFNQKRAYAKEISVYSDALTGLTPETFDKLNIKYEDGGNIDKINFKEDVKYYPLADIREIRLSNDRVINATDAYGWNIDKDKTKEYTEIFSGLYASKRPIKSMADVNQLSLFEKGGKLPLDATYIKRSDIESVLVFDESKNEEIEIPANKVLNGFWYDNSKQNILIDKARKQGLLK